MKKSLGIDSRIIIALLVATSLMMGCRKSQTPAASLLIGEWEAQGQPDNLYRMRVEWNSEQEEFKGFLTQQGKMSEFVGFTLGEHVWTATPTSDPNILAEEQKWRSGSDGVSTEVTWTTGTVDLTKCSADELVSTQFAFKRVK